MAESVPLYVGSPHLKVAGKELIVTGDWSDRDFLAVSQHLKDNYPYLFSLAMRTNPFDPEASPIVQ